MMFIIYKGLWKKEQAMMSAQMEVAHSIGYIQVMLLVSSLRASICSMNLSYSLTQQVNSYMHTTRNIDVITAFMRDLISMNMYAVMPKATMRIALMTAAFFTTFLLGREVSII